jgi:hypothetical protein
MFVALSRFTMDVMSPLDNRAEVWLVTRWRDEQSYLG